MGTSLPTKTTTPFSFEEILNDSFANNNSTILSKYTIEGTFLESPAPYTTNKGTNPTGSFKGKEKGLRGGSWYLGSENITSLSRRTHEPKMWGF